VGGDPRVVHFFSGLKKVLWSKILLKAWQTLKMQPRFMTSTLFWHLSTKRGASEDSSQLGYYIISTGKYSQLSNVSQYRSAFKFKAWQSMTRDCYKLKKEHKVSLKRR